MKRYKMAGLNDSDYPSSAYQYTEDPKGEWVKYKDIHELRAYLVLDKIENKNYVALYDRAHTECMKTHFENKKDHCLLSEIDVVFAYEEYVKKMDLLIKKEQLEAELQHINSRLDRM